MIDFLQKVIRIEGSPHRRRVSSSYSRRLGYLNQNISNIKILEMKLMGRRYIDERKQ